MTVEGRITMDGLTLLSEDDLWCWSHESKQKILNKLYNNCTTRLLLRFLFIIPPCYVIHNKPNVLSSEIFHQHIIFCVCDQVARPTSAPWCSKACVLPDCPGMDSLRFTWLLTRWGEFKSSKYRFKICFLVQSMSLFLVFDVVVKSCLSFTTWWSASTHKASMIGCIPFIVMLMQGCGERQNNLQKVKVRVW